MNLFETETLDQEVTPLQPEISRQLHYSERLLKWNPYSKKNAALCYQFEAGASGGPIRLIPDACMDFLFRCDTHKPAAVVSGLCSAPRELRLEPGCVYFGFKPYSPKGIRTLNVSWAELGETQCDLRDLTRDADWVTELVCSGATFDERVGAVLSFARSCLVDHDYTPDFVEYSELQLCQARGNLCMGSISDSTGYTGRYCREKFKETHGVSIKSYSNIMRFQNTVRMLSQADAEHRLSDIVYENGYFDQSHLNRDFQRYTGSAPLRYQKEVLRARA